MCLEFFCWFWNFKPYNIAVRGAFLGHIFIRSPYCLNEDDCRNFFLNVTLVKTVRSETLLFCSCCPRKSFKYQVTFNFGVKICQGRSVHVNRVSRVCPANTFKNKKNMVFCLNFVVQWYSIHWNTAEPIRQNASLASFSQPDVVSQLVESYARRERANTVHMNGLPLRFGYYRGKRVHRDYLLLHGSCFQMWLRSIQRILSAEYRYRFQNTDFGH
jgi:hypothetical protein